MTQPSIRRLVGLVVVAPVVAVCAVLAVVSHLAMHDMAEDLGVTVMTAAAQSLRAQVARYLDSAMRVSDLYARRIARGDLPHRGDFQLYAPLMLDSLLVHHDVASICFANDIGESTWLLRAHGRLELGFSSGTGEDQAVEYVMQPDGRRGEVIRRYRYVAPQRPWFLAAPQDGQAIWTPIYFWFGDSGADSTVGTGYTRVVHDPQGQRLGVLVIDVTLSDLSDFLRSIPLAEQGYMFIVDDAGLLVASSHGSVNSAEGQRMTLGQMPGAGARAAAEELQRVGVEAFDATRRIFVLGQPARLQVVPVDPYPGIRWRLITVVPESAFLQDAVTLQHRVVALSLAALVGGVVLALLLSRSISRPLLLLTRHVRRVGAGQLDGMLDLHVTREFSELSGAFNRMAGELKERLKLQEAMQVAQEVQQSLLPAQPPQVEGLQIAARNSYCDTTGGDYYDFIELDDEGRMLIAVGDVMGHGIGAALIMSAARAALHTHCFDQQHVGQLLDRINLVLSEQERQMRFVTMLLIWLDPTARRLRWASAGHGTPLLFDPTRAAFHDLSGGHIPLAIDANVSYEQYELENLAPGTVLVLGTDGLWESVNPRNQPFGYQRVRQLVSDHHRLSAEQIAAKLEDALRDFRGDQPIEDDVTFVVVKIAE